MVSDAAMMLRSGNTDLKATETPETHYVILPPNAKVNTWTVLVRVPQATSGTPTSYTHELMTCPDTSDPTVNGNWVAFNPPIVYTQDLTKAHEKALFVHPVNKYLAVKSTVTGGTAPSAGAVTIEVSVGRTAAAAQV